MSPSAGCSVITWKRSSGGMASASTIARCTPSPSALRYSGEVPLRRSMRTSGMENSPHAFNVGERWFATKKRYRSSAFSQLVPRQISQPVVRRILIGLAQRRIIENLLDELINRQSVVQHHHSDVNQLRRRLPDHRHSQQLAVRALEYQLQHPRRVSRNMAPRVVL